MKAAQESIGRTFGEKAEFRQATRSGTPLTTADSIDVERSFKDQP